MNPRWILVAALGLLCCAQVWGKPTDEDPDEDNYPEDDGDVEAKEEEDYEESDQLVAPAELLTKPQIIHARVGDNVILPCELKNGGEGMTNWQRDIILLTGLGTKMTQDERINLLPNNSLLIRHVTTNDSSAEYVCDAVMIKKKVVHQLIVSPRESNDLEVRVLPQEKIDINDGSNITLRCEAAGNVASIKTMIWSRGGQRLKSTYNTDRGIYLDIHNANRHLAGDYQCLVDTGLPTPIIKHIELKVKHIPQIEYDKERVGERLREHVTYYTGVGVDTNITCVVHSHPPVRKIHWFKHINGNDHTLKTDDEHLVKSNPHRSHHVLTIKNTQKSDLGVYSCKAWNELGEASGPQIHVRDTPDQPLFKKGMPVDDSIVFQWRVNSYKPIVETELLYRKDGSNDWRRSDNVKVTRIEGKEHVIEGTIRGIEAGKHEAMVRARNDEEHFDGDNLSVWGPNSEVKKFDGEYKEDSEAESVRGSAMSPTVSLMTLLLFMLPFAYLRL